MGAWQMPLVAVVLFLPELTFSLITRRPRRNGPRASLAETAGYLANAVTQVVILFVCWSAGWWSSPATNGGAALLSGVLISVALMWAWNTWNTRRTRRQTVPTPREYVAQLRAYWPRGSWARLLMATRAVCTSTSEEVLRSIFAFGPAGDAFTLTGAALAVLFDVALHAYQGKRHVLFHVFFAVLSIAVIAKWGVFAAIVLHVSYNLQLQRESHALAYVRQLRAYHRQSKPAG